MKGIFLTGATGLLGQYLLRDLLLAGQRAVVLVRCRNGDGSAYQRIDSVLRRFERDARQTLPRPTVVEGCLHDSHLGLSPADRRLISAQCNSVLHCAASVKFQRDAENDEPSRSNVRGTKQLVDFCSETGIREFHHVSTAYICGDRTSQINEDDFDQGQQFRNVYEQSKFEAEQVLRETRNFQSLTIYRPSIIVGDFETGFTSTFHGYYLPLQLVHTATLSGYLQPHEQGYMAALGLTGKERKNVVPVNWVSAATVRILLHEDCHGRTYHLTNPHPVTTRDIEASIREAIDDSLNLRPVTRSTASVIPPPTADFRKQMEVYGAYLSDDPIFDSTHTAQAVREKKCPRMDHASLKRIARFAIASNFGWPRKPPDPIELDVGALLRRLPEECNGHSHGLTMSLQITGSGGGLWRLAFNRNNTVVTPLNTTTDAAVYMNVYTMRHLLLGSISVEKAVAAGRVVLEGRNDVVSGASGLLEALFTRLRESE
jgi:thioester reductase-like protein